jgi:hypothetical protein
MTHLKPNLAVAGEDTVSEDADAEDAVVVQPDDVNEMRNS